MDSRKTDNPPPPFENETRPTTPLEEGFERVITPFKEFIRDQTVASTFLIVCTALALAIANSALGPQYETLVKTHAGIVFGDFVFEKNIRHWVNDALMALFFFVIGLEIKREVLVGELRYFRHSLPVIAAAAGGMFFPAVIYSWINLDSSALRGWGIPMATDTAFAVGVLALLGTRAPRSLAAFLTALAIIDDIGAIMVIALFYTDAISTGHLAVSLMLLIGLMLCNLLGIRSPSVYFLGGILLWLALHGSGVHATIAGILVALIVPARPKRGSYWFLRRMRHLTREFEVLKEARPQEDILSAEEQHEVVERVQETAKKATTPLQTWLQGLQRPVALFVLPVFALANAGVPIEFATLPTILKDPLTMGIVLGLVLGKSVGITGSCWLVLRSGLGRLPAGMNMRHVAGIGLLSGVGFTMSFFIAGMGFEMQPDTMNTAKTGILLASALAGAAGYLWLRAVASWEQKKAPT